MHLPLSPLAVSLPNVSTLSPHPTLSLQPVEREPLIYHLDSVARQSEDHGNLPDEFFEVTVDDVRKRFAQLKSERWGGKGVNESGRVTLWSDDRV